MPRVPWATPLPQCQQQVYREGGCRKAPAIGMSLFHWIRITSPISSDRAQCTHCDLFVFYTESYTVNDANKLLKRIEERNIASKYNQPAPHQDDFVPAPVSTQSSKNSGQCAKQSCSKPRNKGCTFSMCKSCCIARPIRDKLCIEHRQRGDNSITPAPH